MYLMRWDYWWCVTCKKEKKSYMEIKTLDVIKIEEIKVNKQGFVSAKKLCFCNEIFCDIHKFFLYVSSWYYPSDWYTCDFTLFVSICTWFDTEKCCGVGEKKYLLAKLIFFIGYEDKYYAGINISLKVYWWMRSCWPVDFLQSLKTFITFDVWKFAWHFREF